MMRDKGGTMRSVPVEELLRRCAEHDAEAWSEMVERHRSLVWSVPLRLGLSMSDAGEVFQDVFESLLRNVGKLKEAERLSSWLYTAARRLSLRRLSGMRRQASREDREDEVVLNLDSAGPSVSDQIVQVERQSELLRLVEELPDRCRNLLNALFLDPDEPDYDAIAARLGIPRGSIGPTRLRCLKRLHELMKERGYPFGH